MEKVCEFCTSLRPVVYCKADEAYLCLSCDAKVHLANALSSRHPRTLLCNQCRYHLAYVQCLDHQILICRGCDQKLHDLSLKHQKRVVRSYIGCPSAKDFAALWGFELNEIESNALSDKFASFSCGSANLNPSMGFGAKFEEGGSSSQQGQILYKDQERQTILQQIIDLKRLQLIEETNHSPKITGLQETDSSSSLYHTRKKYDEKCDQQAQNSQALATDIQENNSPMEELKLETLSSTFSQLDNLPSSSITDLPLHGESFWTCRSPLQSNQLWSHNIQDLGICEELICQDDFNIPDVDLTFQNFEELFGGDQDPIGGLIGDNDLSYSSIEKDISDIYSASTIEDSSAAVSITISQSAHEDKEIRPSHSTMSFSISRFNAESSVGKGKYKKKSQLCEKQVPLQSKKPGPNVRKRMKVQVAKAGSY